uniref:Uncharacterized protein n=1 Tax=Parascaris univalens TaxID=6257 RepID=A0A914ZKZ7_PARUN
MHELMAWKTMCTCRIANRTNQLPDFFIYVIG